jgi:acyl carrier protein
VVLPPPPFAATLFNSSMRLVTTWRIRKHVKRDILEGRARAKDPLAARELDSLQVEQLVAYIEERFGVYLADEELVAESFASIPVLARLVERKRAEGSDGR